jgi:hypothetical protein
MTDKPRLVFVRQDEAVAALRALGLDPKAPPMSGRCVICGKALNTDPAAGEIDKDHSICNTCFPPEMADEWQGRAVDVARIDLTGPRPEVSEIHPPADPFIE